MSRRQSVHSGRLQQPAVGWRQYSYTQRSIQSVFVYDKGLAADEERSLNVPPISWFQLYRYATSLEILLMLIGVILASLNGLFLPLGCIIYGEFTALLIDRTVMTGTSTPTITLALFGGGRILTNATKEENRAAMIEDSIAFGIGCSVFSVLQFIAAAISVDVFNYTALNQIDRVKENFLRAVLRQDISWYDLNTTMNFATKVSDDIEKYREGIAEKVPVLVYLVMSFVTSVVIAFIYGWELTLIILMCTPVIIATTALVAKIQSSLTSQELKAYSYAGVLAEEVLSSIRTVVAFGGEAKEIERYSQRLEPAKKTGAKKGAWSGVGSGVMWLIIYATYAVSFWYGVGLVLDSRQEENPQYTPAALMIIFVSVLQGALNVGLTAPHMEAVQSARASAGSVMAVIDRKPLIDSLSEEGSRPELTGEMELRNVFFRYPARSEVQVLNGLNLSIKRNETVALVGPSGGGKSTVLQLLQRMYDPDSGEVLASGYNLKQLNVRHFRDHIAVVGQEPVLFAGTISENISFGNPNCTEQEIIVATKEAYCHNFIKKLPEGYNTLVGERGAQMSGGQKQRIAIARALVRKPKFLILDEATSALDSSSEAKVQRALDAAAEKRTTVMVSHRLSTVLNATRIVYIDKGIVIEQGTHEELFSRKGRYFQLVLENEPSMTPFGAQDDTDSKKVKVTLKVKRRRKEKLAEVVEASSSGSSSESDPEAAHELTKQKMDEQEEYIPTTREIFKLCAPEKYLMMGGMLASLCVGSSFPLLAILFGETYGLLDKSDEDWIRGQTNMIAVLFLLVGVYTGIGIFFQIYIFNLTGVRLTARLRVAVFESMLKQEIGWFEEAKNGVGSLCARLAADAAAVQGATGTRIGALMQASSTILVGITIAMVYTWKMTLVSLMSVPVVIGAVVLEGHVLAAGLSSVREASNEATTIASEAITNIRTVSAFCGEKDVLQRYKAGSKSTYGLARRNLRWRGLVFAFGQTAPVAGYAVALWYGGVLVADGEIHYKSVITVSEALIYGAWMMGQALAFAPNFGAALAAAGRVMTLLGRKTKIASTPSPSVHEDYIAKGRISYKNIKFRYPTRRTSQVLKGVTMLVPEGKRVALVGPSGCGKSTLMQLLQRLFDPDEGTTYLDEYNIIKDMRLPTLRRNLGIVSQEPVLFDRSIRENIAYGDNTRHVPIEEIVRAAKAANVHSFISALPEEYETRVGSRASQLSGGQKQRIAIARALIRNPRVLLLDEATSALDTQSEKVVEEALDRASVGRTCLIIAHRLATIKNADLICVLDNGVVKEKGNHNELIALRGIYANLYELQCGLVAEDTPDTMLEKVVEVDEDMETSSS